MLGQTFLCVRTATADTHVEPARGPRKKSTLPRMARWRLRRCTMRRMMINPGGQRCVGLPLITIRGEQAGTGACWRLYLYCMWRCGHGDEMAD